MRCLWITLKQPYDGRITFGAFDKLFKRQLPVHVLVHLPENLVSPLLRRRLVLRHLHDRANHLVDGRHDLEHLLRKKNKGGLRNGEKWKVRDTLYWKNTRWQYRTYSSKVISQELARKVQIVWKSSRVVLEKILILIQPNLIYAFRLIFEISEPSAAESIYWQRSLWRTVLFWFRFRPQISFAPEFEEILFSDIQNSVIS